jgi:hypothetical protein
MPAPSPLAIATSSLNRLVKEEASYHKELEHQQASIAQLEQGGNEDENAEYQLRQEVCRITFNAVHLEMLYDAMQFALSWYNIIHSPLRFSASCPACMLIPSVAQGPRGNQGHVPSTQAENSRRAR